jgi:MbtH protein
VERYPSKNLFQRKHQNSPGMERSNIGMKETEKGRCYKVVTNNAAQYSIWPTDGKNPIGWKDVGVLGSRNDCFAFIEKVWPDVRPLSSRTKMGSASNRV